MAEFKTIEEAEQFVVDAEIKMRKKSCPVFKELCRAENCMSYSRGKVNALSKTIQVFPPHCLCALVDGIIEIENAF